VFHSTYRLFTARSSRRAPSARHVAACRRPDSSSAPDVSAGSRAIRTVQDAWSFHAAELNAVLARWGGSRDN